MTSNYQYTQTWFLCSEIQRSILSFIDPSKEIRILEIGCFEGLSSVFFADNLLDHPISTLICVDPFLNCFNNDHKDFIINNNAEMHFDYNISICKHSNKITVHKTTSDEFFHQNTKTYDLIYIDGSHESEFIIRDMENSFHVLENNGIMWMDDYEGGDGIVIKNVMNSFLDKYAGQYDIIFKGYQLAIRKNIKN